MSLIVRTGLAQGYDKGLNKGLNMVAGKGVSEEGIPLQNPQAIVTQVEITDELRAKQADFPFSL